MRNLILLILILLNAVGPLWGQGQGNLWFCYTNSVVDFSGGRAVLGTPPNSQPGLFANSFPGYFPENGAGAQMAIADATGKLLFFVKVFDIPNNGILGPLYAAMPKIFDRNGYSMVNGAINANWENKSEFPLIVPHPGNIHLYYVFYTRNGGLQYSVVDMTLNNGLGDVDKGQKDVLLSGWGTINGTKLSAVTGCDCIWLVVRSRTANQYYSYRIDEKGIHPEPVISDCGLLPPDNYNHYNISDGINWSVSVADGGRISFDKSGTQLAVASRKGIELCDFERCSGVVKNPRLIDSLPFFGLCFSPNSSRLYASQMYPLPHYGSQGQVYQFDLGQPDPAAITRSKTLVVANRVVACFNPFMGCYCDTLTSQIADLRLGPDNKIYMSNNKNYCGDNNISVWPLTPTDRYHYLHVIHNPDALGLACNPEMDYLKLNTPVNNTNTLVNQNVKLMYLPPTVVLPPSSLSDTSKGESQSLMVCFKDSFALSVPEGASCPVWDNGSEEQIRTVYHKGKYWLRYLKACTYTTDTFLVDFTLLPEVPPHNYGCRGEGVIAIKQPDSTKTVYEYILRKDAGIVNAGSSDTGYRFIGLSAGDYRLQIKSGDCDTLVAVTVAEYPQPEILTAPADTLIKYGDTIRLWANGAQFYTWWPSGPLDRATQANPLACPLKATLFEVIGRNEYGCVDTGHVQVRIDYTMCELVPNAFSPNGDGLNDVFKIEGIRYQKIELFKIFNRLGQEVFSTVDPDQGWDGTFKGKPCAIGTYFYQVRLSYPNGTTGTFKGDLTLIR